MLAAKVQAGAHVNGPCFRGAISVATLNPNQIVYEVHKQIITAVGRLYLKRWCNGDLTNTLIFWVDNLVLYGANKQMHVFLPEGTGYGNLPYGWGDRAVDLNCQGILFPRMQQNNPHNPTNLADFYLGYICRIDYKTNRPSGQSMIFGQSLLCVLYNNGSLGEWSLEFSNATDFVLTAPGGATASSSLPLDVAQDAFNDNLAVYFGHQPDSQANIFASTTNRTLILAHVQFVLCVKWIEDRFEASSINRDNWTVIATVPQAVWIAPRAARWMLHWPMPDSGFKLQTSTNVVAQASWMDLMDKTTGTIIPTTSKTTFISDGLSTDNVGYFRLLKPGS